jgi:hypothetical protein
MATREQREARQLQKERDIPYTMALRLVRERKAAEKAEREHQQGAS